MWKRYVCCLKYRSKSQEKAYIKGNSGVGTAALTSGFFALGGLWKLVHEEMVALLS